MLFVLPNCWFHSISAWLRLLHILTPLNHPPGLILSLLTTLPCLLVIAFTYLLPDLVVNSLLSLKQKTQHHHHHPALAEPLITSDLECFLLLLFIQHLFSSFNILIYNPHIPLSHGCQELVNLDCTAKKQQRCNSPFVSQHNEPF